MAKKIIYIFLILTIFIIGTFIYYTKGQPITFLTNYKEASSMALGRDSELLEIKSLTWMNVKDFNKLSEILDRDFSTSKNRGEGFLLIIEGTFSSLSNHYAGAEKGNIKPKVFTGKVFSLAFSDGSGASGGVRNSIDGKLEQLGDYHTLGGPSAKIAWFWGRKLSYYITPNRYEDLK